MAGTLSCAGSRPHSEVETQGALDCKREKDPESLGGRSRSVVALDDKLSIYSFGVTRTVELGELDPDLELRDMVDSQFRRSVTRDE